MRGCGCTGRANEIRNRLIGKYGIIVNKAADHTDDVNAKNEPSLPSTYPNTKPMKDQLVDSFLRL